MVSPFVNIFLYIKIVYYMSLFFFNVGIMSTNYPLAQPTYLESRNLVMCTDIKYTFVFVASNDGFDIVRGIPTTP